MKIAIVYDCMFPYTVGGAERWYVQLAERLSAEHEVSYVTLRQWPKGEAPTEPCRVVEVGPRMALYTESGRRKIWPPLRFGWGVFWHLLVHGGRYDVVHGASFPYFSVIGAKLALLFHRRTKLVIDWHEIWTKDYWIEYLGPIGGRVGNAVQSLCKRLPDHNFTESHMHEARLAPHPVTRLTGLFTEPDGRPDAPAPMADPPRVVFAGRLIPEKNALVLPAALVAARRQVPELNAAIFGRGPQFEELKQLVSSLDAESFIDVPGFVPSDELESAVATAACVVLPSVREGYGMVVLEAVCQGTPVVVVEGPDNAAKELIDPGINGLVAASADAEVLGDAIVTVVGSGSELRDTTWGWYERNRATLSIEDSLAQIAATYEVLLDA